MNSWKKIFFFGDIVPEIFWNFSNFFLKNIKNDDIIKLIGNWSLDDNEQEKVYEAVFSNDISSILEGGGQYDPPPCVVR